MPAPLLGPPQKAAPAAEAPPWTYSPSPTPNPRSSRPLPPAPVDSNFAAAPPLLVTWKAGVAAEPPSLSVADAPPWAAPSAITQGTLAPVKATPLTLVMSPPPPPPPEP